MKIRPLQTKDAPYIEQICLGTSSDPMMENPQFREAILEIYCRYYLHYSSEYCYVAVDHQDRVQGYILCVPDFLSFEEELLAVAGKHPQNPVISMMAEGTLSALRPFSADYPAHLHIDLLPDCQGQGIGRKLIQTLCNHLREKQINGLMLNVSNANNGAIRFYEKCGFSLLEAGAQECAYGIRLQHSGLLNSLEGKTWPCWQYE